MAYEPEAIGCCWSSVVLDDVQYYSGFTFDQDGHEMLAPGERVSLRLEPSELTIARRNGPAYKIRENIAGL